MSSEGDGRFRKDDREEEAGESKVRKEKIGFFSSSYDWAQNGAHKAQRRGGGGTRKGFTREEQTPNETRGSVFFSQEATPGRRGIGQQPRNPEKQRERGGGRKRVWLAAQQTKTRAKQEQSDLGKEGLFTVWLLVFPQHRLA